jgi:replicative DNA helicase
VTATDEAVPAFTPSEHIFRSEMATAGAAMLSARAAEALGDIVRPEHFRAPANGIIFAAALALAERGGQVDPVTVLAEITHAGNLRVAGDTTHIHDCLAANATAGDPLWHARQVRRDADRRNAGAVLVQALDYVRGETYDPEGGLERVRQMVEAATAPAAADGIQPTGDLLMDVLNSLERDVQPRLATPWTDLNAKITGFGPGELVIVAARAKVGKSIALLGTVAHTVLRLGRPAVMFSMEMPRHEIMTRLIASEGRVPLSAMIEHRLTNEHWDRIDAARQRIEACAGLLVIDDTPYCTLPHIRSRLRGMARTAPAALAAVDYIGLMRGDGKAENRQNEIAGYSRGLKLTAAEFDIPVIAAAQLNRQPEHRTGGRPQASDLRESGALEADASMVILLHRPEMHDPESGRAGEIDFIVDMNRNGPRDTVPLLFQGEYARCVDPLWTPSSALGDAR